MRWISLCVIWLLMLAPTAVKAQEAKPAYEVEFLRDVEYGTGGDEKLMMNVAVPKECPAPRPCVVLIHGGGWMGGKRQDFDGLAREVAAHGYTTATVSYRLAPKHPFPAQVEDVRCSVRYLRAHAEKYGIDPKRIGAAGASAGGHLAMMLGVLDDDDPLQGTGGWADQSSRVQCVVSYFGPTQLIGTFPEASTEILRKFIGGTPAEKEAEYKAASPITYVTRDDPPMLLFQGTKDVLVPHDQATQFADALSEAGVPGRIEILVGANHGWGGAELQRTMAAMRAYFDEHLKK
jgi:acetyl esterase/lipase